MTNKLNEHEAQAIMIGNRYFYGFGKGGRVQTAWSLAGATLFLDRTTVSSTACISLEKAKEKLTQKRKKFTVIKVSNPTHVYEKKGYAVVTDDEQYFYGTDGVGGAYFTPVFCRAKIIESKDKADNALRLCKAFGAKCQLLLLGVAHA